MNWLYLVVAIVLEVIATSSLTASNGFTKPVYSAISVIGYAAAIYLLALVLKTIPVGVAYAIWSGAGVALVTIVGVVIFHQKLSWIDYLGISLIVSGVIILNLFSAVKGH